MSLISDVKTEINAFPLTSRDLRKFGILVGGVFLILYALIFLTDGSEILKWIFLILGGSLFLGGLVIPDSLKRVYLVWMTGALILGWIMSRVILTILFFLILTPIALIAKVSGKKFLDLNFRDSKSSYWILRDPAKKINYNKMY